MRLLENGFVAEAAASDDGLPREVLSASAEAYRDAGWLTPAARAYALAGDREGVRDIAARWLDAGLFEEAAMALHDVALPMTPDLLQRYVDACTRNGWLMHLAARELLA